MSEEIEGTVLEIVRDVLGKPGMGPDDDAFDHGATSLSFVRILASIHSRCGVRVKAPDLDGIVTARNLAAHVLAASSRPTADSMGV
ncbi:acyl carrier protein [Sphaerimonospora sp. CA-214678]|uniref:acyl carrier protein n=1 Tax=Sphaerimonospora sp. CA-214678 TaxID=3240029 RepID=UPI003D8FE0C8